MLAPPCSSFSMARNRYPVRSRQWPMGFENLKALDREKVKIGNRCMKVVIRIATWCQQAGVPCCIENPQTSYMWATPAMTKYLGSSTVLDVHQCAFGSRWRKATRLAFSCPTSSTLWCKECLDKYRCHGHHGFCSFRVGRKHVTLEGSLTTKAAAYPTRLSNFLARNLLGL